ncbi:MAG: triphosphoribosyl-dephospho-CoA synthase [Armatimonadota bacterium]|nr:triphosphoribosyl-dephospho-CoA synthase [Armatimonadota bacterium]
MTREDVGQAAQLACLLEVSAPKPGNVTPDAEFADARFEDFVASALAIGPVIAAADRLSVGACVLECVRATRRRTRTNTNLGTVLLLCPLARAYGHEPLRDALRAVLSTLTQDDARDVYEAIRLARPGGLGQVPAHDVWAPVAVSLRDAMASARDRDTIAREYVTDFAVTFGVALPAWLHWSGRLPARLAVVQTYLTVLSDVPDTLVARKTSALTAAAVSRVARRCLDAGGVQTEEGHRRLARMDTWLRRHGNHLNPGTTADLVAAALFTAILEYGFEIVLKPRIRTPGPCGDGADRVGA